ncbi:MAG TPA: methylenetetrahydrofolate reductase C-terminal domain-containing protein [Anaerohalosphaeraceae bacterium]|jgi:ferredoxin|nr:methylenetetrahydrofolate reductase C-terminal domain-containing protein [Anaerohalosphaeraceae bacterium]
MIVADRKPFDEIIASIAPYNKIMIMGCGGCVTICFSGGTKAVELLASQIRMARRKTGADIEIVECTPERQCEYEFIDAFREQVASVEAVLSIACGVGVQTMNEHFPDTATIPGLNTKFMGAPVQHGLWQERCAGCGDCVLQWTGGLCPVARCAKRLFNGPCGGSSRGRCEVDPDVDCVWQLIHDRLEKLGKLDNLEIIRPARDWRPSTNAGQRKVRFDEVML